MKSRSEPASEFVVCISNDDYPASLELHKICRALPDDDAARSGDLRVVDENGGNYLYPATYFSSITVAAALEEALLAAS